MTVLAVDPQTPANLYAAGISGVFKSSDGGANWARASTGIIDPSVVSLAIDPVTPTTLYAGSIHGGRVVKSTDGGNSWAPLATGPTLVVALAINPQAPATIYASQQQSGILKSADGGATWNKVGVATLPSFPTFKSIVIDPTNPNTIYAGESGKGVYKSVDGGATWAASNSGFTTGTVIQVLALAVDPQIPATLYAAANTSSSAGLYKSTNGGASWANTFADNSGIIGVQAIRVDPQNSAIVYIGTFGQGALKSSNGGANFAAINTGLPKVGVNVIALNPQNPASLHAGTQNGVFASSNAGTAWSGASNGLALTTITAVAVDPSAPGTIYAATKLSGLFKSVDGGGSWSPINTGVPATGNLACNAPNYSSVAIDPATPSTLYAAAQCTLSSQVLKSTNGGASWSVAASGLPGFSSLTALAIDPLTPQKLLAGTATMGLYQSLDAGASWSAAPGFPPNGRVTSLSIAAGATVTATKASGGTSAAVATTDNGVKYSLDGDTWKDLPVDAATAKLCANAYAYALLIGENENVAFWMFVHCISLDGESNIAGGTLRLQFSKAAVSATVSKSSTVVSKAAKAASTDATFAWGLPDGDVAKATACGAGGPIAANPLDPTASFYLGADCGVLKGTNHGQQMATMNDGLPPNTAVLALAVTPSGSDAYAGAESGGVWRITLAATPATPVVVVEFYNASLDHYFITWAPDEIAKLDAGTVIKGWTRTGESFKTYTSAQGGTSPVCRYYIPPGLGDSHFFGRGTAECNATGQKNPSFVLESSDFMQMFLPTGGVCPANTTQIYRVFSNRPDANHRYMTNQAIRAAMVSKGWLAEGDGPDLVVMCAPQ